MLFQTRSPFEKICNFKTVQLSGKTDNLSTLNSGASLVYMLDRVCVCVCVTSPQVKFCSQPVSTWAPHSVHIISGTNLKPPYIYKDLPQLTWFWVFILYHGITEMANLINENSSFHCDPSICFFILLLKKQNYLVKLNYYQADLNIYLLILHASCSSGWGGKTGRVPCSLDLW